MDPDNKQKKNDASLGKNFKRLRLLNDVEELWSNQDSGNDVTNDQGLTDLMKDDGKDDGDDEDGGEDSKEHEL